MFLGEKPLFQFKISGIPVKFGFSFVFNIFFVFSYIFTPLGLPAALVSITLIILVHELGHAFMARGRGYRVEGVQVQFAGGYCEHEACDYERDDVLIAWGGVIGQAVLLAIFIPLYFLLYKSVVAYSLLLQTIFLVFIYHNIFTVVYNLLPFPGFDGRIAWQFVIRRFRRHRADPYYSTVHRGERRVNRIVRFKKPRRPRGDGEVSAEARAFADKIMEDIMKKQRGRTDDQDKKK